MSQLDAGMKSGEVKMKPEEYQAQRQKLLARENVLVNSLDQLGIEQEKEDSGETTTNMRNIKHLVDIGYATDEKEAAKTIYKVSQGLMSKEAFLQKGALKISGVRYTDKQRDAAIDDLNDMANDMFGGGTPKQETIETRFADDPKMEGYVLGEETENGYEVKDGTGKLIGYYK